MDPRARGWVDRDRVVDVGASGARVWTVVAHPRADGTTFRHRVVDQTPGRRVEALTPLAQDCTLPTMVSDGTLFVSTDGGDPTAPRQLASRDAAGVWRTWTDAPGGVETYVAAEDAIVFLERHRQTAEPWSAPAVAVGAGPARLWNRWLVEDSFELTHIDRDTGRRRSLVTHRGRRLSQCTLALSPTGGRLAFTPLRVARDGIIQHGLEIWSLSGACAPQVVWGPPDTDHAHPVFSPDGSALAFVRHTRRIDGHGRRQLCVLDLSTGSIQAVAPGWPGWLVPCAWTASTGIVCRCVVAGREGVFAVRPGDTAPRQLDTGSWSWQAVAVGREIWGLASSLNHRPHLQPITAPGPPAVVRPWSPDPICPSLFWPAAGTEPRPLVVMVHGGPVSSWTDSWHPRQPAAFFHGLGCHVLLPNPIGSTGYGDAHVEAIWQDWDACAHQLQGLLQQAAARPDVSMIVLFGGSFGGWAVNRLATLPDTPDLAGVVTHAGIFDHGVMWAECDEPAAFAWHLGPGPMALHRASPAGAVEAWNAPALILHGARDFNVPVGQALALHHALERCSIPHRLVVLPDEGHHILTPRALARWWSEIADFLSEVTASLGDSDDNGRFRGS